MRKILMSCLLLLLGSALFADAANIGPTFSLDPASPALDGTITPDDILSSGPVVYTPGRALGLQENVFGGVFDNLADVSFGQDPMQNPLYFSVDRVTVGLPGTAVFTQAQPGVASAAGDVYVALPPFGSNSLGINAVSLGLTPGFFGDDLDGLNAGSEPRPNVYFALDRLSSTNGFGTGTLASDLLVSGRDGHFSLYALHASMGLDPGDAIDGLVLRDANLDQIATPRVDQALLSLDPFSPDTFTFTGLPYLPCVPGHLSPADVCVTDFTGTFSLWASAVDLGLRPDDNVDALATAVPEPGGVVLVGSGLVGLWVRRRQRGHAMSARKGRAVPPSRQRVPTSRVWPGKRLSAIVMLLTALSMPLTTMAQNEETTGGLVLFGTSPPLSTSRGILLLASDGGTIHAIKWTSSDSVLGDIDIGIVETTHWLSNAPNPARFVFTGSGDGVTLRGEILFAPYNRGVVDVTQGSHRRRYLLTFPCDAGEDPYQCDVRMWACALQGASASPAICPNASAFTGNELVCPPEDALCLVTHGQVQDSSAALAFRVPDGYNPDIGRDVARLIDDDFRNAIDRLQCARDSVFIPYFSGIQAFNDSANNASSRVGGDAPAAALYLQHARQGAARNSWALLSYYNRWTDALVRRFGGDATQNPALIYDLPDQQRHPMKLLYRANRATERFATRTRGKDTADGPAQGDVTEWGDQLETRMLGIWASLPAQGDAFSAHDVGGYDTGDAGTTARDKADFATFFMRVVNTGAWKAFMYQAAFEVATAFKCGKRVFAHSGGGVVIGFIMRLLDADPGMQQRMMRQWPVGLPGRGAFVVIGLEAVLSQEVVILLNRLPSFSIDARSGRAVVQNYVAASALKIRSPAGSPTWDHPIVREINSVGQRPLITATVAWGLSADIGGLPNIQSIGDVFLHSRIGFHVLINGGLPGVMLPAPLGR